MKLFEQAEIANYTEVEYKEYEDSLKVYRDMKNCIDTAFSKGEAEGFVKGEAEGFVKGEAEGFIKGEAEGFIKGEAIGEIKGDEKTAISMKKKGFDLKDISEITGLSIQ